MARKNTPMEFPTIPCLTQPFSLIKVGSSVEKIQPHVQIWTSPYFHHLHGWFEPLIHWIRCPKWWKPCKRHKCAVILELQGVKCEKKFSKSRGVMCGRSSLTDENVLFWIWDKIRSDNFEPNFWGFERLRVRISHNADRESRSGQASGRLRSKVRCSRLAGHRA